MTENDMTYFMAKYSEPKIPKRFWNHYFSGMMFSVSVHSRNFADNLNIVLNEKLVSHRPEIHFSPRFLYPMSKNYFNLYYYYIISLSDLMSVGRVMSTTTRNLLREKLPKNEKYDLFQNLMIIFKSLVEKTLNFDVKNFIPTRHYKKLTI